MPSRVFNFDEAIKAYNKGISLKEVLDIAGCSKATFYTHMKNTGVPKQKDVYKISVQEVVSLYNTGIGGNAIAKILGTSKYTVYQRLREAGMGRREQGVSRHSLPVMNIIEEYDSGKTAKQICKIYGCHLTTIYKLLEEHGVPRRDCRTERFPNFPYDEIVRLYTEEDWGSTRIAKHLNTNVSRVLKCIRDRGHKVYKQGRPIKLPINDLVARYAKNESSVSMAEDYECDNSVVIRHLREAGVKIKGPEDYPTPSFYRKTIRHSKTGRVIKVDSMWEAYAYGRLHQEFGEEVLFQGEYGKRERFKAPLVVLDRVHPNGNGKKTYHWSPDFAIPSKNLLVEVKGQFHAMDTWNKVLLPAIGNTNTGWSVAVWYVDPRKDTYTEV